MSDFPISDFTAFRAGTPRDVVCRPVQKRAAQLVQLPRLASRSWKIGLRKSCVPLELPRTYGRRFWENCGYIAKIAKHSET